MLRRSTGRAQARRAHGRAASLRGSRNEASPPFCCCLWLFGSGPVGGVYKICVTNGLQTVYLFAFVCVCSHSVWLRVLFANTAVCKHVCVYVCLLSKEERPCTVRRLFCRAPASGRAASPSRTSQNSIFRRFPAALEVCAAAGAGVPTLTGLTLEPLPGTS